MEDIFLNLLSLGIIFIQVIILGLVLVQIFQPNQSCLAKLSKHVIGLAFMTSLVSMIGSLYFSDILGLEPCLLCWYQRIFHFANVFILGLAFFRKDRNVIPYAMFLSVVGGLIAFYHVLIQITSIESVTCSFDTIDCKYSYFTMYGYITIPVMSLTVFAFLITILCLGGKRKDFDKIEEVKSVDNYENRFITSN